MSIDYYSTQGIRSKALYPHTVLVFVPGNPGCVGWYIPLLEQLVTELGIGFAARGISYAGHGTTSDIVNVEQWVDRGEIRETRIPWTVDGQIEHKVAWMEMILEEMKEIGREWTSQAMQPPRFIFLSHSIGAHMVQRLCTLRPDMLARTCLLIHLMPFMRMDAPQPKHTMLSTVAESTDQAIRIRQDRVSSCRSFASFLARLLPPQLGSGRKRPRACHILGTTTCHG